MAKNNQIWGENQPEKWPFFAIKRYIIWQYQKHILYLQN